MSILWVKSMSENRIFVVCMIMVFFERFERTICRIHTPVDVLATTALVERRTKVCFTKLKLEEPRNDV